MMAAPISRNPGSRRCAVCGTFIEEGVVCPEHRVAHLPGTRPPAARKTWEELPLEALAVPPTYQRDERPHLVRKIVREFDPDQVGTLTVCEDADHLWLLDGQHRWLALVELGYERWMCEVLHDIPVERQAEIFDGRNSERVQPHPRDAFRARYVARDAVTVDIVSILIRHGYAPPFGSRRPTADRFVCVGTLYDVHGWGLLDQSLALLRDAWPTDRDATHAAILLGVAAVLRLYPQVAGDLAMRMRRHSAEEVLRLARARNVGLHVRRLWGHVPDALVELYNHGRPAPSRLARPLVPDDAIRRWKLEPGG